MMIKEAGGYALFHVRNFFAKFEQLFAGNEPCGFALASLFLLLFFCHDRRV